ncbi:hypothetical protein PybrP1_003469, partial [[Pythium] brassicae (nom. inval.)]
DEIAVLHKQMQRLEYELTALKYQALTSRPTGAAARCNNADSRGAEIQTRAAAAALPPVALPLSVPGDRTSALSRSAYTNQVLHDAIQSQQLELAGLQALVSQYMALQESSPVHLPIRLGRDPTRRHEQLVVARERVLQQSKRFVARRSLGLDAFKLYTEQERFESDAGDYSVVGFDVVPLGPAATSVRRVFDTLFFQVRNIEITFSEMMGHIAVRENDDTGDAWFSQHRVVASITDGVFVEANVTVFADFEHGQRGRGASVADDFGIIVLDWIDDDELYPYRPAERARRDTSCIFTVQAHSRRRRHGASAVGGTDTASGGGADSDAADATDERVVVLTRWSQTKLHKPLVHTDNLRAVFEMRASIGTWGDRIVQSMHESSSGHAEPAARRTKKRHRPSRKPTYYKRKEETEALQAQLALLQAQLACLTTENQILLSTTRQQQQPHRQQSQSTAVQARRSLLRSRVENDVLRDAVQTQRFATARAYSAFSSHVYAESGDLPFGSTIRLGKDWNERRATLLGMKDQKLRDACRYMAERALYLDQFQPYNDTSRFINADGDYCLLLFDVLPFDDDSVSVKKVFDALLFYFTNMEISITEMQGDLMLRENDECSLRQLGVTQSRLVSGHVSSGVQIETNSLEFYRLFEAGSAEATEWGGGRAFAVVVADFVDEDALFPYASETRARHDVTGALVISLEPRTRRAGDPRGGPSKGDDSGRGDDEGDELVVVLKRVGFLTVRATEFPVAPEGMEELRRCVEGWGEAMLKTVRVLVKQQCAPPPELRCYFAEEDPHESGEEPVSSSEHSGTR